jgi:hypothetical protein
LRLINQIALLAVAAAHVQGLDAYNTLEPVMASTEAQTTRDSTLVPDAEAEKKQEDEIEESDEEFDEAKCKYSQN